MSYKLAEAFVEIAARRQKLVEGLAASQKDVEKFVATAQARLEKLRGVALKLLVPLAGAGAGFIKLASDMEESESKFRAVFKEQARSATEFSKELEKRTGAASDEIRRFMSGIQDTFVPMGIARGEAAKLSGAVTELAYDLASFNNLKAEDVMNSLTSALVGNHMTVRKFGVVISQAVLDQELLAMGFRKSTEGASEQEKIMARLSIITKGTADAQGDATRTAGSFANSFKALIGQARQAGALFGNELLPYAMKFVGAAKGLVEWIGGLSQETKKLLVVLGGLTAGLAAIVLVLPQLTAAVLGLSAALTFMAANPITYLIGFLAVLAVAVYKATTDFDNWGKAINRVTHDLTGLENAVTKLDKEMAFEDRFRQANDKIDKEIAASVGSGREVATIQNAIAELGKLDQDAIMNGGAETENTLKINDIKRKRLHAMLPEAQAADEVQRRIRAAAAAVDESVRQKTEAAQKRLPLTRFGMTAGDNAKIAGDLLMGGPGAGLKSFFESSSKFKEKEAEAAKKTAEAQEKRAKEIEQERVEQRKRDQETRSGAFRRLGVHAAEGREMMAELLGGKGLFGFLEKTAAAEQRQKDEPGGAMDRSAMAITDLNRRLQAASFESEEKKNAKKRTKSLEQIANEGVKIKNPEDVRGPAMFG